MIYVHKSALWGKDGRSHYCFCVCASGAPGWCVTDPSVHTLSFAWVGSDIPRIIRSFVLRAQ